MKYDKIKYVYRLIQIIQIFAKYNSLFPLESLNKNILLSNFIKLISNKNLNQEPGKRLVLAIKKAGPSFIKLGQALSTRPDIVGESISSHLENLQDKLPPFSASKAKEIIEHDLNGKISELFLSFDDKIIAAASMAQVHFAVTSDGHKVAVKVLRPNIEKKFSKDIDLFFWLATIIEKSTPKFKRYKLLEIIKTFQKSVKMEMNLEIEAASASELSDNFKDDPNILVPKIDWKRTSKRVLTTERITGVSIDQKSSILSMGQTPEKILKKLLEIFFQQIFRDGFFHADIHPGNIFIIPTGKIGIIDFGIMGRIDLNTRIYLGQILLAFLKRDYAKVAKLHFKAGWVPAYHSITEFTQMCRIIGEPILENPKEKISIAKLLGELFQVTERFEIQAQPELLLLQKAIFLAEGTSRKLSPNTNIWKLIRPLIEKWLSKSLAPETLILHTVENISDTIYHLPKVLNSIQKNSALITNGSIKLHPDTIKQLQNKPIQKVLMILLIVLFLLFIVGYFKIL